MGILSQLVGLMRTLPEPILALPVHREHSLCMA